MAAMSLKKLGQRQEKSGKVSGTRRAERTFKSSEVVSQIQKVPDFAVSICPGVFARPACICLAKA